eukprot:6160478-Amphidinium_carterae.1
MTQRGSNGFLGVHTGGKRSRLGVLAEVRNSFSCRYIKVKPKMSTQSDTIVALSFSASPPT